MSSLGEVTIYAIGTRRWEVRAWHLEERHAAGKIKMRRIWHRRTFSGKKIKAALWAEQFRARLANGTLALKIRSPLLALKDQENRDRCERMGTTPEAVIDQYELKWNENLKIGPSSGATVAELVEQFLAARKAEGEVGHYSLADFEKILGRFAKDFRMPLSDVRPEHVKQWLDAQKVAPRTWNNYLAPIKQLAKWCSQNHLAALAKRNVPWKKPQTFTPAEMRWLLESAHQPLRRCLAVGAFAGLRTEEIFKIEWSAFKWDEGHIHVSKTIAKTRQHEPPILPCLRAWLGTIEETGRFCPYKTAKSLSGSFNTLGEHAGATWAAHWREQHKLDPSIEIPPPLTWRRNSHRKSWISNRLAITKNETLVADEAGTSLVNIHTNYLDRPSLSQAQKYFGLTPGGTIPQNIVQLHLEVG